jgi:hypothetical protein
VRSLLIFLSLLAGMSIPALAHAATPPGSIGIRLLGTARTGTLAHAYVVNRVAPGSRIDRRVEITNNTGTPVAIAVYPAAAAFRRGRFAFASGHTRNELSRWTSVGRSIVRLAPGGRTVDTVTIAAPKHTAPGERYGVIWAELSAAAPTGGGITLVNRVGVRMYVSIGRGGASTPRLAVAPLTAPRPPNVAPRVSAAMYIGAGLAVLSGIALLVMRLRRRANVLAEQLNNDRATAIARRAYDISLLDSAGSPDDNWRRAEQELDAVAVLFGSRVTPRGAH